MVPPWRSRTAHRRQADAVPGERLLRVQALERAEQLVGIVRVETGAVVLDHERMVVAMQADARRIRGRGELPCVVEQVLQQVAGERGIRPRHQAGLDADLDPARGISAAQFGDDVLRKPTGPSPAA